MDQLIAALQVFRGHLSGYQLTYPTYCSHEVLEVVCIDEPDKFTEEELKILDAAGFEYDDAGTWKSYRFGSC